MPAGPRYVLDASAALAVLFREPGWEAAAPLLETSAISAVNASEVIHKLIDKGAGKHAALAALEDLNLAGVVDFTKREAFAAAVLKSHGKRFGLSLGDRACLATASILGVPVVTADRRWSELKSGVELVTIR